MWLDDLGLAYWVASAIAPCIALFPHIHVGMQAASYFCVACVFFKVRGLGAGSLVACKQPRTSVLLACFLMLGV